MAPVLCGAENDGILWMSSLEAKFNMPKNKGEKKPTAEQLEQVRQEKVRWFFDKELATSWNAE